MSMEEARERYLESFDLILKAWTQEEFSHKGKLYQIENGSLYMKPVQKQMTPIWVASSSDETLIKSGEMRFSTMGIRFVPSNSIPEAKVKNDVFKEGYIR